MKVPYVLVASQTYVIFCQH